MARQDRDEHLLALREPEVVAPISPVESLFKQSAGLSWWALRAARRARRVVESHRELFEAAARLRKSQRTYALETGRLVNVGAEIVDEREELQLKGVLARRKLEAERERLDFQWQRERAREDPEEVRREEEKAVRARLEVLRDEYERFEYYEDPQFLDNYALKNKDKLLREQAEIREKYRNLHKDKALVALLKKEAPEIYARATWQMEALRRAEQLDVEVKPPPSPRPKKTPVEFRAIAQAWESERAQDKIAHAETQLESLIKMQKMLDRYSLDPEDRERIEAELREQILRNDENSGKILGPS